MAFDEDLKIMQNYSVGFSWKKKMEKAPRPTKYNQITCGHVVAGVGKNEKMKSSKYHCHPPLVAWLPLLSLAARKRVQFP